MNRREKRPTPPAPAPRSPATSPAQYLRWPKQRSERGDLDRATAIFAPDVEWDVSRDIWRDVVGGGQYRGIEGVLAWMRDLYEAWETFDMSYEDGIDAGGDQVVGVLCAKGRGRVSGVEVEHHPASVTTVSEGKVTRVVWYPTREEALEAVGLQE